MRLLHQLRTKIVSLFSSSNRRRAHRVWAGAADSGRANRTFNALSRTDANSHTPRQVTRAHYLTNDSLNLHPDAEIHATFKNNESIRFGREPVYSCSNLNKTPQDTAFRIPARSVRLQVQAAPSPSSYVSRTYPKDHQGYEHRDGTYMLTAQPPWLEFPILNTPDGRGWAKGQRPGPVRAIYNDGDRNVFDVVYHDPLAPKRTSNSRFDPFSMAIYRPASHRRWAGPAAAHRSRLSGLTAGGVLGVGQAGVWEGHSSRLDEAQIRYTHTWKRRISSTPE